MTRKKNRYNNHENRRSSASNGTNSLELRNLLESLPQELYNHIYDLTFTAEVKLRFYSMKREMGLLQLEELAATYPERVVTINEKPPHLLHVDRKSRAKFAASYFGGESVFVVVSPNRYGACFSHSHLELIRAPHYVFNTGHREVLGKDHIFRRFLSEEPAGEAYADRVVFASLDEIVEIIKQYAGAME
ncbi:uncharacterized protein RHO25_007260 [Cercospora beticola]|uniref:F-box domain-containing protein n=1 Tax=Cercospora beticola TaxID=122368 RepID=A0ABZ0NSW0_CERBT|nr:hypothetical protein RHO25_007260 [Cercospora beticola]